MVKSIWCRFDSCLGNETKKRMRIYIGNIDYSVRDDQLELLAGQYDDILSCKIIRDQETDQSKGFGFVDTLTDDGGNALISELHETELAGRKLKVHEAGQQTAH